MTPRFDAPVGRYLHVDHDGLDHRVYLEQAGVGVPLLLQHTAGAHGVQWRHVFEDEWVTSRFQVIAHDLPFHGKSLPPPGRTWWAQEYKLSARELMEFVIGLADTLEIDKPVFMGCSVGGLLALDLARWHPDRFRAVVAIEPSLKVAIPRDSLAGFSHPRVSNEYKAALMYGIMSPTSPEPFRREVGFVYSAAWPPLFAGDLEYYAFDHDLTGEAARIDTSKIGVHLLTGEYDYSAPVAHGQAAHDAIPGSTFTIMRGLGHFPMAEDPDRFLEHLRPVLQQVLEAS
jgi:pimeloyl-ACP methyl ester carboxylesterase